MKISYLALSVSFILLIGIFASGCIGISDPSPVDIGTPTPSEPSPIPTPTPEIVPSIEDVPFYIPGYTTILPAMNPESNEFLAEYGPVTVPLGIKQSGRYAFLEFDNPIPDRGAEVVQLTFLVYGNEYTRILKNMHISGGKPDVYSYLGRINKSDESSEFFIHLGPGNKLTVDFPWRYTWIQCDTVQNNEFASATDNPLHLAYSASDVLPVVDPATVSEELKSKYDNNDLSLYQINKSDISEYDEVRTLGEDDYLRIPELRILVENELNHVEINRVKVSYDTFVDRAFPEYISPHKIYEIGGKYYHII
ncbi:hypothetical protein [Methanocorpusculum vombati]|uniref:DM13 domain-containing protein n=1 Tax=Methanocorpusculum vombati TaxID=3002864 RepID=A0ABT4ILG4_9EURY|nr:hypothetical protein [Methanocorpusculum vombati]MCZ9320435.1 hypothetical protein [Methanocorpusculum sp.]MCZ0862599.1 hypothetical protein [Methanocorpusculum vombati]MDE2520995.1 hypothetical protein [Methanocorpusculum sp.]MDE2533990.1 hypothetical protein [Methanocorpusculum sp.]MDE2546698.1 hypothetical protein [Methanocorpusculum sp.]